MTAYSSRRARALGAMLAVTLACGGASAADLTLSDILARAAAQDPTAPAAAARVKAAEADMRQAAVGPRPRAGIEAEDFAGTGPYSPVERSQTTFYYERDFERGGKVEARERVAGADLVSTRMRGRLNSLDLLAAVQSAWVEATAADAAVKIAADRLAATERLERDVAKRVARALDPLFAGERARARLADARIAHDHAQEEARIARAQLAAIWGGTADFTLDPAPFQKADPDAPGGGTPDLDLMTARREAADARIRVAQAGAKADPTVRLGVRHFSDGNEAALTFGVSIPLGTGAANRGILERAQADRVAAEADFAAARIEHDREIARLTAGRTLLAAEIRRIDAEVLPLAEKAVGMVRDGFNRGGTAFTYLDMADAQSTLIDTRLRRVELLRRFHLDGARLDRLTGRHLSLLSNAE